ncbi:MAG: hypothetical protein ACP5U2_02665 [Bryobacteraceae bacterium]
MLAAIEDRIWAASARGRAWELIAPPLGTIRHLRLVASPHGYCGALWFDPASGLRGLTDPRFAARE